MQSSPGVKQACHAGVTSVALAGNPESSPADTRRASRSRRRRLGMVARVARGADAHGTTSYLSKTFRPMKPSTPSRAESGGFHSGQTSSASRRSDSAHPRIFADSSGDLRLSRAQPSNTSDKATMWRYAISSLTCLGIGPDARSNIRCNSSRDDMDDSVVLNWTAPEIGSVSEPSHPDPKSTFVEPTVWGRLSRAAAPSTGVWSRDT